MTTEHAKRSSWKNELLPNIVDHLSQLSPDAIYAEYPVLTQSYDEGYRQITYAQLANAVDGAAWWLANAIGQSTRNEVLAYIGLNDIRNIVLLLAACKAGYVLFFTSPRNSVAAHVKLFERLNCTKLLTPDPVPASAIPILNSHELQHLSVPSIEFLLDQKHQQFSYDRLYMDARLEPLMIIHSSGSTGFPKPIVYSHQAAAQNLNMLASDPPPGITSMDRQLQGKRVLNCFPPFHGAGLASHLFIAIPFGSVMISPLSDAIATAQGVVDALHKTKADVAFLVPSILLELSQNDDILDFASKHLKQLVYCGGDLPQAVGDKIAAKIPLVCQYGASELGLVPQLFPEGMTNLDWKFICPHPCLGFKFKEITEGSYELYVEREAIKEATQPTFSLFPELSVYDSRDLFKPHPTIPHFWSWQARADDIIVFLNGEKTNPISMEQHVVACNPQISAAIVVGTKRFQASLLLEAVPAHRGMPRTAEEEIALIEIVWPSIQEANSLAPAHARIDKSMIILMTLDKPAIRAGKGTIQRAATLEQYAMEIEELYAAIENDDHDIRGKPVEDVSVIAQTIRDTLTSRLDAAVPDDDANFFTLGLDSLQAMRMAKALRSSLRVRNLTNMVIYNNPTVRQLTSAIAGLQSKTNDHSVDIPAKLPSTAAEMDQILKEYRASIHAISVPKNLVKKEKSQPACSNVVLLTGSTGTLGTYLVDTLLSDPSVDHIYCLNRKANAGDIQRSRNQAVGSPHWANHSSKLTFFHANLASSHQLGLATEDYQLLQDRVTHIIHNAWPVNFNLSLETFRPHLQGLVNLFALSATSKHVTSTFYISSVSSVLNLRTPSGFTPEEVLKTNDAPYPNGYAESKFMSELLCDEASHALHIPVAFARVGQIAGPVGRKGIWNKAEWVPSLMLSSVYMGVLPDSLGAVMDAVDWIPVDLLAGILVELSVHDSHHTDHKDVNTTSGHAHSGGPLVYHLTNPQSVTWSALIPDVMSCLKSVTGRDLVVVSAREWLEKLQLDLEKISRTQRTDTSGLDGQLEETLKLSPALKLFDFFQASLLATVPSNKLDLTKTLEQSDALKNVGGVNGEWLKKWIAEWLE